MGYSRGLKVREYSLAFFVNIIYNDYFYKLIFVNVGLNDKRIFYRFITLWYNDKKEKNVIKRILNQIKQAFKNYFQTRKLAKFFHLAFILIGVALAFLNMTYSTYTYIDTSNISYDNDVYGVVEANEYNTAVYNKFDIKNYSSTILQAMEENYIDLAFPKSEDNYLLQMRYNSFLKDYFNINANAFDLSLIENDSLLCGNFTYNEN